MYQDDSDQAQAALPSLFGSPSEGSAADAASVAPEDPMDGSFDSDAARDEDLDFEGESTEMFEPIEVQRPEKSKVNPGALVVYLLKGYVDRAEHQKVYDAIVNNMAGVSSLCKQLGLQLLVDSDAGYAYVKSMDNDEITMVQGISPPRLLLRRQLPFFASFILILLRQRLLDFDVSGQDGVLVLERQAIIDQVKAYLLDVHNDVKLTERINKGIDDLCDLGLIKSYKDNHDGKAAESFVIKRIINAIVTPTVLGNVDEILSSYIEHLREGDRNKSL